MSSILERFPRLRVWGPILLGLLVVLIGALIYLQTRHGFRHVVVPVADALLPGSLEVRDGLVDLPGSVELEGLRYVDPNAGVEVVAERGLTDVSILSLLGGGPPVIHVLEVSNGKLTLTLPEEAERSTPPGRAHKVALLPLVVKRGHIDDFDISIRRGDVMTTVDRTRLTISEMDPSGRTQLTLAANCRYDDAGSGDAWSGPVDATTTFGRSPSGDAFEWSGTVSFDLREAPTLPAGAQAVTLKQAIEGSVDVTTGSLRATSSLQVEQGGASLAAARSELSLADNPEGQELAGSLTIDRLTAAALNLALAGRAEARFEAADIKGRVDLRGLGDRITVQSFLEGERIRLRLHDSRRSSPPIAVSVQQAALLDRATQMLTLETLEAAVSDRSRSFLVASLDRPLTVRLDHDLAQNDTAAAELEVAQLSVTLREVTVDEVRPWLALTGARLLDDVRTGKLQGQLTATVRNQAETVALAGALRADDVMIETPPTRGRLGPLRLEQDLRATLTNLEELQIEEWQTNVKVQNRSVGRARAAGAARLRPDFRVGTLSARLTLNELPAEMLNPLLAGAGGTRIARARLNGMTKIDVTEDEIVWDTSFHGGQISLAIPDAARPTEPIDLELAQSGRFDRRTSVLTLATLNAKVLEGRRAVLVGTLDQPLTLDLARREEDEETPPAMQAKPVRFKLGIHQLSVEQLRPRLALLGSHALDNVTGGVVEGRLRIDVLGKGETIDVAGQLDAANVGLREVVAAPLTFRTSLEGSVAAATRLSLKTLVVRVMAGPKELFLFQGAGSTDIARGAVNATAHAFSVDVVNALRRVGWMSEQGARMAQGGELSAKLQLVTAGAGQPLGVTGEAKIGNLRTVIARGKSLTNTVTAQFDLGVNGERTLVSFSKAKLDVHTNGKPAGSINLAGRWPVNPADRAPGRGGGAPPPGEVVLTARDFDSSPLVVLLDLLPGRAPGLLPVSIDATVSHDPASQVTRIAGRETVGPLVLLRQDAGSAPTTIHLEHDLSLRGEDDIQITALRLTSEREPAADNVSLSGNLRVGAKPRLELRGAVAQLDAAWYVDLFSASSDGQGPRGGTTGSASPAEKDGRAGALPLGLPLDLDLDTSIGTIRYRDVLIGKGRLKGKGTGERADVILEPTGFAGGIAQGTLAVAMKKGVPHLAWSAEGKDIDIHPILLAFRNESVPEMKGHAAFTTSGTGRGQGEALKQSLSGTAVLSVTDGQYVKSKLLTYAAEETGLKQYEGMKFDLVHVDVKLADGWAQVLRLLVKGSGLTLKGSGKIGLNGQLDGVVTPGVTGLMAQQAQGLCTAPLMRTVDGITEFPYAVKVSGTISKPEFSLTAVPGVSAARGIGELPLRVLETLVECGNLPKAGEQPEKERANVLKEAGKLFEGLLGGAKGKEKQ